MEQKTICIEEILRLERMMFDRAQSCESRCRHGSWDAMESMRSSQMEAWPEELLESYCGDLYQAKAGGRNLLCEKRAYIMCHTNPKEYDGIRDRLPIPSMEKVWLAEWICNALTAGQEAAASRYPKLARQEWLACRNRSFPAEVSVEAYLQGELLTYSVGTLRIYAAYIESLEKSGKNLCLMILENFVRHAGYADLAAAEAAAERKPCREAY